MHKRSPSEMLMSVADILEECPDELDQRLWVEYCSKQLLKKVDIRKLSPSGILMLVADIIEKYPEEYDQRVWADTCETAFCIGGHIMLLMGYTPHMKHTDYTPNNLFWKKGEEGELKSVLQILTEIYALLKPLLSVEDVSYLFCDLWAPNDGLTVPEVLRKIANGVPIKDVSNLKGGRKK